MSTPAPSYFNADQYRDVNRRMADSILAADPAPYREGGYVRRVVAIRGRRSGDVHAVPIAVVTLDGRNYIISPTRARNWVRNIIEDPSCFLRSRDTSEPVTAIPINDPEAVAAVVATYLALMNAPWAVAQFPFPADASHAQIAHAAAQVAVFELKPGNA